MFHKQLTDDSFETLYLPNINVCFTDGELEGNNDDSPFYMSLDINALKPLIQNNYSDMGDELVDSGDGGSVGCRTPRLPAYVLLDKLGRALYFH